MSEKKTFSLAQICTDLGLKENIESFNQLLSKKPKQEWIKTHPMTKQLYIPIAVHEKLLRVIFQQYNIEIREVKPIFNSIVVSVRVHYLHPITNTWMFHDGVGAVGAQTKKDTKPSDMSEILSDAVMKGAPAAESYAIKDACEKFGSLFGADINRKDVVNIDSPYDYENMLK